MPEEKSEQVDQARETKPNDTPIYIKLGKRWRIRIPDWLAALGLLCLVVLLVGGIVLTGINAGSVDESKTIDVGRLVTASFSGSGFESRTQVETERGVYLVEGVFQSVKGNRLVIQVKNNGIKELCDKAENICKDLATTLFSK